MRHYTLERQLCEAIKKHQVIRLQYKNQYYSRTFNPYIVYHSPSDSDRILVAGTQTKDDSQPLKGATPHKFEVQLISALTITDKTFEYDTRFDPALDEYRNGIICVIKRLKVE